MNITPYEVKSAGLPAPGRAEVSAAGYSGSLRSPVAGAFSYGLAIFSSAFLLFQIQPLITKIILPWFGGVAAVWTVCLVFFQVTLLLGYLYAHLLTSKVRRSLQGRIHILLLALSFLTLPILPKNSFKPAGPEAPASHILVLLTLTVGIPYLVLSSTSPLLQAWYSQDRPAAAPYRLYALSNAGSMLALLSYPVIVEPALTTKHQAVIWSVAYAAVCVLCGLLALGSRARAKQSITASSAATAPPGWKAQLLWLALAMCGSALLLAITNHISQNIASVPFLWIIPLSLYLSTFILSFDRAAWYPRDFFLRLLAVALGGMAYALDPSFTILPMKVLIPVYCAGLWVCCMFCHGELARLKPDPAHLTSFYLMISFGGALGAALVALVAPHVFSGYYELQCALGFCALLVLVVQYRDPSRILGPKKLSPAMLLLAALVIALLASLVITVREQKAESRRSDRNFYGVLRVIDHEGAAEKSTVSNRAASEASPRNSAAPSYLRPYQTSYRRLVNGTIDHGLQFLSPQLARNPTTYYAPNSGVGIALKTTAARGPLRVGIVGLGAGTLAAYGRPGDTYRFYEINPLDVRIANEDFTFLRDSQARIEVVLGDARLSLEREPPEHFDALVLDAFSSDSIPVHLLTREAFELYFRHLKPDGLLAIHVSNQYLNLDPVVDAAAAALNKQAIRVDNSDDHSQGIYAASWILMGNRDGFYGHDKLQASATVRAAPASSALWTDNYSSLIRILK